MSSLLFLVGKITVISGKYIFLGLLERRLLFFREMRPKARGLAQHGGPPGWLEESDPTGVFLYVMDGPYRPPFPDCIGCPDRS